MLDDKQLYLESMIYYDKSNFENATSVNIIDSFFFEEELYLLDQKLGVFKCKISSPSKANKASLLIKVDGGKKICVGRNKIFLIGEDEQNNQYYREYLATGAKEEKEFHLNRDIMDCNEINGLYIDSQYVYTSCKHVLLIMYHSILKEFLNKSYFRDHQFK